MLLFRAPSIVLSICFLFFCREKNARDLQNQFPKSDASVALLYSFLFVFSLADVILLVCWFIEAEEVLKNFPCKLLVVFPS